MQTGAHIQGLAPALCYLEGSRAGFLEEEVPDQVPEDRESLDMSSEAKSILGRRSVRVNF